MSNSRVWVRQGQEFVAVIESFESLRWTRRYHGLGSLFLRVPRLVDGAQFLVGGLGNEISVVDDPGSSTPDLTYVIESLQFTLDENGQDMVEVQGVEAGLLHMRICLPPPHQLGGDPAFTSSHHVINGDTETAMRALVDNNVGPSAPADRQFPNLVLDTNQNRGVTKKYQARFEQLSEKLAKWAQTGDLGYEVQFDASTNQHVFTVLEGEDKTDLVEFSVRMDNTRMQEWRESGSDQISLAYVAGQGEGTERDMAKVHEGTEPTGKDRRELFVDARDLELAADLPQRGEEVLGERRIEESFTMELSDLGPFQYKTHWDLGDTVTLKNDAWSVSKIKRVVEVATSIEGDDVKRQIVLGKAPLGLRERVINEIGDRATSRAVVVTTGVEEGDNISVLDIDQLDVSGNRTLQSGDEGFMLRATGSGAHTFTIPGGVFATGDVINAMQWGTGQITFAASSGATLRYDSGTFNAKSLGQFTMQTIYFAGTNDPVLGGQLELA